MAGATENLSLTFDETSDQTKRHDHASNAAQKLRSPAKNVEHETSDYGHYEAPAIDDDLDLGLGLGIGYSRLCENSH
jgi:hypothetical protein